MGLGDWIMSTAVAREANIATGLQCVFTDGREIYYDDQVFESNPRIAKVRDPEQDYVGIFDFPGNRPYIKEVTADRFVFDPDFRAMPGELFLERKPIGDYILIEPNVKRSMPMGYNKSWPFGRWQEIANLPYMFVQLGTVDARRLTGVKRVYTESFRQALHWLSGAKLLVTTDGGLHHAAAALGVPAVVLWGGMASPVNLGYASHTNIWHGDEPCGSHSKKCPHCRAAMKKISVDEVTEAIKCAI